MVKPENYITIQGWMVTELKLKGNELLIYALIFGFTQTTNQNFTGSLQYIADWTNSTKQGVLKCLKNLIDKGFIEKREIYKNKVKYCEYRTTKFNGVLNKVEQGMQQSLIGGIKQSLPNNISLNNNSNNNNNNDSNENVNTHKPSKHKYGQYNHVLLDDEQYNKLVSSLGEKEAQRMINTLDEGIELKGYTYKNHYLAIIKWKQKENSNYKIKTEEIKETVLCSCHNKKNGYESDVYYNKGSVCPICILEGKI